MQHHFTLKKEERLCNKIVLDNLFTKGKSVFSYPLKFIFLPIPSETNHPVKVVFSVPKRSFKQAVKRNLIRRRMKEAYRLYKPEFYKELQAQESELALMIIYVDKKINDYSTIDKGMTKGLKKLCKKIQKNNEQKQSILKQE